MDFEKGKQIFFKYNGSHFHIDRACYDEYKKCNIPLEIEKKWIEEIKEDCLSKIEELKGNLKIQALNNYIQISDVTSSISLLIKVLNGANIDTFSSIIVLETTKQYLHCDLSDDLKEKIINTIENVKKTLLENEITIDDSYKNFLMKIMIFLTKTF